MALNAEIVSLRPNFGYAVRGVDLSPDAQWKLELAIDRVWEERTLGPWTALESALYVARHDI